MTTILQKKQAIDRVISVGAIDLIKLFADCIKEAGSIPSGHLYAMVMDKIDIHVYTKIIDTLKNTGLIEEKNNLLTWKGV